MNEFMDFHLVVSDPSLYRNCRGFAGCGLSKCRSRPRHRFLGLSFLARLIFCDHREER
ncbi:MAG: hypothetical protein ACR2OX_11750 [Methyloligellaceae bacterium]